MRKLSILILIALFVMSGVAFALQKGTTMDIATGEIKSTGGTADNCPRTFRLVRYVQTIKFNGTVDAGDWESSHLTPDTIVIWHTASVDATTANSETDTMDGVTVTLTTTTCDSRVAGVTVTNLLTQDTQGNSAKDDLGKNNWGYICTFGPAQVTIEPAETASVGMAFGTGNLVGGTVEAYAPPATDSNMSGATSAYHMGIAGFFCEAASASEQNIEVFVRCE